MPFRDLPGVTKCRFKKGEYLIRNEEPLEYIYYLQKGIVHRKWISLSGQESILSSKAGGGIVQSSIGILIPYRKSEPRISYNDFIAYTNCICYRIPIDVCKAYLRANPELLEEVVGLAMDEYNHLAKLFFSQKNNGVSEKLCSLLLERARETEDGLLISRKVTNIEMAEFLSIHKITVARILRALKDDECIVRVKKGLLLKNPAKLQQYANGELQLKYK